MAIERRKMTGTWKRSGKEASLVRSVNLNKYMYCKCIFSTFYVFRVVLLVRLYYTLGASYCTGCIYIILIAIAQ